MKNECWILSISALAATLMLVGCGPKGDEPNVEIIQGMMDQPAMKAQRYDDFFPDHSSARVPPSNTIPVGFSPYRFPTDPEAAAKESKNPYQGDMSPEVLLTGLKFFNTNCQTCHGVKGDGNGKIRQNGSFPMPIPSLLSEKVRKWEDGSVYHVITMGQGMMGSYASHIPQKYRWQVVNYIRKLQQNAQENH
ncbi:MAG: cytochrome c [Bdellovibrio sp.]|nr:MAG: cytochrome c [Bdellovibrio sp.]